VFSFFFLFSLSLSLPLLYFLLSSSYLFSFIGDHDPFPLSMYQPQKAYFPPMYRHQDVFSPLTYQCQKLILHRCVGVVICFTYGCIGINITFITSVSMTNVFSSPTYRRGVLFLCQYQIILFRQCISEKSTFLANVSTTESHHLTNVSVTESHLLIDASTIESHRSYKRELVKRISAHFLTDVSTIEPHIFGE
jgi:hypothetical protein